MYEVERKVRVPHADVRDHLEAMPVEFLGTVEQRDTYFEHPQRSFAATDEALRVRVERSIEGGLSTTDRVTYKGPRLEEAAKTRREIETTIGRVDAAIAMFEALDFTPVHTVEKTREQYGTDEAIICLDAVEHLGEFVEVEARDAEDVSAASAVTEDLLETLGIADAPEIQRSYLGMLLDG